MCKNIIKKIKQKINITLFSGILCLLFSAIFLYTFEIDNKVSFPIIVISAIITSCGTMLIIHSFNSGIILKDNIVIN